MKIVLFPIIVRQQSDNDNEAIEQIDEDIAVTQSQMNFICPITQVCCHCSRKRLGNSHSVFCGGLFGANLRYSLKFRQYQFQALPEKRDVAWGKTPRKQDRSCPCRT